MLMRKKPKAQKMNEKIVAPTPIAARWAALGKWPITHVSTRPTRGVDEFARMAGPAIAQMARSGLLWAVAALIVPAQCLYKKTHILPHQRVRRRSANLPSWGLSSGTWLVLGPVRGTGSILSQ